MCSYDSCNVHVHVAWTQHKHKIYTSPKRHAFILMIQQWNKHLKWICRTLHLKQKFSSKRVECRWFWKNLITGNIFMAKPDQSYLSLHKAKLKPDLYTSEEAKSWWINFSSVFKYRGHREEIFWANSNTCTQLEKNNI